MIEEKNKINETNSVTKITKVFYFYFLSVIHPLPTEYTTFNKILEISKFN